MTVQDRAYLLARNVTADDGYQNHDGPELIKPPDQRVIDKSAEQKDGDCDDDNGESASAVQTWVPRLLVFAVMSPEPIERVDTWLHEEIHHFTQLTHVLHYNAFKNSFS